MRVNHIFYSIQGEGHHTGRAAVFIRLSGCNLKCQFCDTEFLFGEPRSERWILSEVEKVGGDCKFVVLTGGEPGMQDIGLLVDLLQIRQYCVAIETNGMFELPERIDWVSVSPKVSCYSKKLIVKHADEFKFVVGCGGKLPNIKMLRASHFWISPENMSSNRPTGEENCADINRAAALYCIKLVKSNNEFKLNTQVHKYIGVE